MVNIVEIKGNVTFKITLDPGVWIFDDRKEELHTFFQQENEEETDLDTYTKLVSKHWDREIIEGARTPQPVKTEKKFMKEILLTGTFGILFEPFLLHAEPKETAKTIVIETVENEYSIPINQVNNIVLCFSNNGKPLTEDGPIHAYFKDGSNKDNPIKNIIGFRIE